MKVVILSASSDIGLAACRRWLSKGWELFGTFRTEAPPLDELRREGVRLVRCDLADDAQIRMACAELRALCPQWDALIFAAGTTEPIGPFEETSFPEWKASVAVNCVNQLQLLHELLPARNKESALGPCALFFSGGGTNNATVNYSAYALSKIALMKMCELLDAEIHDMRFAIVGPGWVKTKIHDETLRAGDRAGANYGRTKQKLSGNECTPMDDVLDCCEWVMRSPREIVGGRNFSVVFDSWGSECLVDALRGDPDLYKLRRHGNKAFERKSAT